MSSPPIRFDRELTLTELLRAVPRAKFTLMLGRTVGKVWRIADIDGTTVWPVAEGAAGDPGRGLEEVSMPLCVDIDVVGHLIVPETRQAQARVAAGWVEMMLASASLYRMAADLHLETVHSDYEALQQKHTALQESESRYRALSGQLEERVKAQVDVIEISSRRLFRVEKMASIGSLAAGMAHEINNPIGFIRSNLVTASTYVGTMSKALTSLHQGACDDIERLWRDADLQFVLEDFPGLLAESVAGADRIARIVGNLKTFSGIDRDAGVKVDLNEAIRASSALIADQLPHNIGIELDLDVLPLAACEPGSMSQVLLALLENARQAIAPAPGTIRISSRVAGDALQISVRDDGSGISADNVRYIFDPFFTTREVGKGMGLGLTIASDIVGAYGGRLEVDTAPGVGSTFTLSLPLSAGAVESGTST